MNVHLYVGIVIALGALASFYLGRLHTESGPVMAIAACAVGAVVLGLVLTFPLLEAMNGVCEMLGYKPGRCIVTDDRTVWAAVFPLEACPLYFFIMLYVNRAANSSNQDL